MKRVSLLIAAVVVLAVGLACGGGGPQSCGRKNKERTVHRNGHTITQRCVEGPSGLRWQDE